MRSKHSRFKFFVTWSIYLYQDKNEILEKIWLDDISKIRQLVVSALLDNIRHFRDVKQTY